MGIIWEGFVMAENKKSFLLYCDLIHTVNKLSDEQAGILLKHILSYVNDENPIINDILIDLVFEPIKQSLKRDLRRYEEIIKERVLAGKLGGVKSGEKRKEKKEAKEAKEANALKTKQTKQTHAKKANLKTNKNEANEANEAVIDSVSVIDSVTDIVKDKDIFNIFRIAYKGTKRGLDTEYANFIKSNDAKIVDLLLPALEKEIAHRQKIIDSKQWCANWKDLQTWINKKCWEQEFPELPKSDILFNSADKKPTEWKEI